MCFDLFCLPCERWSDQHHSLARLLDVGLGAASPLQLADVRGALADVLTRHGLAAAHPRCNTDSDVS